MSAVGDDIVARLKRIEEKLDRLLGGGSNRATASSANVADDRDLDSQWGDPKVRKDPPRWTGDSFEGCAYSECSSEYLNALAGFLDWKAEKDQAKGDEKSIKYAGYARKDAARARGWARRNEGRPIVVREPPTAPDF